MMPFGAFHVRLCILVFNPLRSSSIPAHIDTVGLEEYSGGNK